MKKISIKNIILFILLFVIFMILLCIVTSFGIIKLNYTTNNINSASIKINALNDNNTKNKIIQIGNYIILPKSTTVIEIFSLSNEAKTQVFLSKPNIFKIKDYHATLDNQKEINKVTSESLGCRLFSKNNSYDYNCGRQEGLFSYDISKPNWSNVIYKYTDEIFQFNNGYLTYNDLDNELNNSQSNKLSLLYIDIDTDKITTINLPPEINNLDNLSIITDKTNADANYFSIIDKTTEKIYFSNNLGINYISKDFPKELNLKFNSLICELNNTKLYCYYGTRTEADSIEEVKFLNKNNIQRLGIYNFNDNSYTEYKLTGESYDNIAIDANENIYLVNKNDLYTLSLKQNKAIVRKVLNNVEYVSSGEKISYVQNNALYTLNYDVANKIFGTNNMKIVSLSQFDDKKYLAFISNNDNNYGLYGFVVSDNESTELPGNRLVDKLPLINTGILVNDIDYIGNTIKAKLKIDTVSDRQTGIYSYVSQDQYNQAINEVNEILTKLGINKDKYNLIYNY